MQAQINGTWFELHRKPDGIEVDANTEYLVVEVGAGQLQFEMTAQQILLKAKKLA